MVTEKNILKVPTVQEFIEKKAGKNAVDLIKICCYKRKAIKDEDVANELKLKVTDVRTTLNRLHYRGIANYRKTKNKKTGWYSYTWKINTPKVIELVIEEQKDEIEKLERMLEEEESYSFFSCKKKCQEHPFEIAAEYQFKCPSCGNTMKYLDNKKRKRELSKRLIEIQSAIKILEKH